MPKKGSGKEKNTSNKAKHKRLMDQKYKKKQLEKANNKQRLKAIIKKANEANKEDKQ